MSPAGLGSMGGADVRSNQEEHFHEYHYKTEAALREDLKGKT